MNMFELGERLKDFSKDQLINEMRRPSGSVPQFLVLSELQRRSRMEQAAMAEQPQQSTVAEDAVAAAGVPQGGLMQIARSLAPSTDMDKNTGVTEMNGGGVVRMKGGGLSSVSRDLDGYMPTPSRPWPNGLHPVGHDEDVGALPYFFPDLFPDFVQQSGTADLPTDGAPLTVDDHAEEITWDNQEQFSPSSHAEEITWDNYEDPLPDGGDEPSEVYGMDTGTPLTVDDIVMPPNPSEVYGMDTGTPLTVDDIVMPPNPREVYGPPYIPELMNPSIPDATVRPRPMPIDIRDEPKADTGGVDGSRGVDGSSGGIDSDRLYEQDKWLALAQFGLSLMSSRQPTLGSAIGEAGQAGIAALRDARESMIERQDVDRAMRLREAIASREKKKDGLDVKSAVAYMKEIGDTIQDMIPEGYTISDLSEAEREEVLRLQAMYNTLSNIVGKTIVGSATN